MGIQWHKLEDEKPPEDGFYLTYHGIWETNLGGGPFDILWWASRGWNNRKTFGYPGITHWAYLERPEEEP